MYYDDLDFSLLIGKTLTSVLRTDDEISFTTDKGEVYKLYHSQDCCECVEIEDICGDLDDLIGSPILVAEETTSGENPEDAKPETIEYQESFTWTFYKIDTAKGGVTIRWYGDSNGYYSESVEFSKVA